METMALSPDLLSLLIGVPVAIFVLGTFVAFLFYKFTRFVVGTLVKIGLSFVVLLSSLGTGFYLYKNPSFLKEIKKSVSVLLR